MTPVVTDDDWVIMASEVGALEVAPDRIVRKGRLEPGKMFLVDLQAWCAWTARE
jgi:glutamate synthase (NADPH/NADH) large chain